MVMSVGSGAAASALQRPSEGLSAAKVLGLAMRVRVTAWSDDRSRAEMTLNVRIPTMSAGHSD